MRQQKKQKSVVDDLKLSIKEMLTSEGIVNEDEMDLSQQEFNTEMVQKSNDIADQLAFANEELKLLFDMTSTIGYIHNTIQLGSVVVTNRDISLFPQASKNSKLMDGNISVCLPKAHSLTQWKENQEAIDLVTTIVNMK